MADARRFIPGIAVAVFVASAAVQVAEFSHPIGLSAGVLAVAIGLLVGNTWTPKAQVKPGYGFTARHVLAAAVILLGLQVNAKDVADVGPQVLAIVLLVVFGAMAFSLAWSRTGRVSSPLAALVGAGTGICGVSAIAAVRSGVGADDDDVAYAASSVAVLGSIGLLLYPVLLVSTGFLPVQEYGVFSGATLHTVPQAVGAGFAGGGIEAGESATIVKLARVTMLAPVALLLAFSFPTGTSLPSRLKLPIEVVGFLVLFAVGSLVPFDSLFVAISQRLTEYLLVIALAGLGLGTRFASLRARGWAPFAVAAATWFFIMAVTWIVLKAPWFAPAQP